MTYYRQLDREETPRDLRVRIRESAQAILHWVENGGEVGPMATPARIKSRSFGSPGIVNVAGEDSLVHDWTDPPFNTPSFDRLIELLDEYKISSPDSFNRYAQGFFEWLEQKRQDRKVVS